jgi:DNA-binding MarR family transcriptional regulator
MNKLPELIPDDPTINPKGLKGLWVPEEILFNENLTPGEKILLSFIYHLDTSSNHCYASNKYLGEITRTSTKSAAKTVERLKEKGYIETVSWDGRIRKLKVKLKNIS